MNNREIELKLLADVTKLLNIVQQQSEAINDLNSAVVALETIIKKAQKK